MIYLERSNVPAHLLGSYKGRLLRLTVTEEVSIPMDAGLWSGGTRELYHALKLDTGQEVPLADHMSAPWADSRQSRTFKLEPNIAVVESGSFCGSDAGLHFYVHPSNAAALLPAPVTLTETQALVLGTLVTLKSAYRADQYRRDGVPASRVEAVKAELLKLGLIDSRGAATVAGKNAVHRI